MSSLPCFLYSRAEISASPSILDGIGATDERICRMREMEYITGVGLSLLDRKESSIHTAMIMWHRFYMRRSLRKYPPALTSVACLLLASKVCEPPVIPLPEFVRIYLQRTEGLLDVDLKTAVSSVVSRFLFIAAYVTARHLAPYTESCRVPRGHRVS